MSRKKWVMAVAGVLLSTLAGIAMFRSGEERIRTWTDAQRPAAIYPDYANVTVPPNIAPLNFQVLESGSKFCARITAAVGIPIQVCSTDGKIEIPAEAWRELLAANTGGDLRIDIYAKGDAGWRRFDPVRNQVAKQEIDPYVTYRYIPSIVDKQAEISLRQRDLRNFDERILFDNRSSLAPDGVTTGGACFNCHTFLNNGARQMLLEVRPAQSGQTPGMILVQGGKAEKIDTSDGGNAPAAYVSWHPSGKLLVFSRDSRARMFHAAGAETGDVIGEDSDLSVYDVDTGETQAVAQISRPDRIETFPAWSPDGRYLYFSSARLNGEANAAQKHDRIQYDLNRISYAPATGDWGKVETVVSAARLGKSITLAEISPDGRFAMFCGHDYGSLPIFQPGSDLYLADLSTGGEATVRRMDEINSGRADSYHTWSSNSQWVVFSSKREDGKFTRLYIAHRGEDGLFGKPFILPQEDPAFYGGCLMTFNRPELVREPVTVSESELARAVNSAPSMPVEETRSTSGMAASGTARMAR